MDSCALLTLKSYWNLASDPVSSISRSGGLFFDAESLNIRYEMKFFLIVLILKTIVQTYF